MESLEKGPVSEATARYFPCYPALPRSRAIFVETLLRHAPTVSRTINQILSGDFASTDKSKPKISVTAVQTIKTRIHPTPSVPRSIEI